MSGRDSFDAAQDMLGFQGCEHTLPVHVKLVSQHPQVLPFSTALYSFFAQPVFVLGVALT